MKICPQCQTSYTDDSLQFCLQDGTPLASAAATNNWSESETVVSQRQFDTMRANSQTAETGFSNTSAAAASTSTAAPQKKSNTALIVVLTVFLTLLIAGAVGFGVFYFNRGGDRNEAGRNNTNSKSANNSAGNVNQNSNLNSAANSNVSPTPTATPSPSPSPKPTLNPKQFDEIKSNVEEVIENWNGALVNQDLNGHLSNYANTVDYYKAGAVGVGKIRADKQRAFENYYNINIDVSNINVTPDETGEKATAVFDKEWNFEGDEKESSGKVQQQLNLAKIGGKWRITAEKDLKVYYINK